MKKLTMENDTSAWWVLRISIDLLCEWGVPEPRLVIFSPNDPEDHSDPSKKLPGEGLFGAKGLVWSQEQFAQVVEDLTSDITLVMMNDENDPVRTFAWQDGLDFLKEAMVYFLKEGWAGDDPLG